MEQVKAALFDMDGVLVDTEPVILAATMTGLAECGVQAQPEDFLPFIGAGEDRFIGGVAEKYGLAYKAELKVRVYQIYQEIAPTKLKIYEGVLELLQRLQVKGIKIALATSADFIKIKINLDVAKLPIDLFDAIISGEDVQRKKPAPDIYLKAAEKVKVAPEGCLVVEDAINGIQAAKAAGMKCIAIASSFDSERLQQEQPDYIYRNISEMKTLIDELG